MKTFLAFAVGAVSLMVLTQSAVAQHGGRSSALGGSIAPRGSRTQPLGGIVSRGPGPVGNRGNFHSASPAYRAYGYPWGYSYYIPGYFDYLDADSYYDPAYGAPAPAAPPYPAEPASPQQPVIINQYFGTQSPAQDTTAPAPSANDGRTPANSSTPANYYLIAYKNHSVYPALAYWVEDKTLHYVTTENTQNMASLDLIDLSLTKRLNQSNEVPFSIPGE